MHFEAERAEGIFEETARLLPRGDRKALRAAEVMRKIYYSLLQQIRRNQFQVFDRRYRISDLKKFGILVRQYIS